MKGKSHHDEGSSQNGTSTAKRKKLTPYQHYLQRETPEQREQRLLKQRMEKQKRRELETQEERVARLREEAAYMKRRRHNETPEKRAQRLLQRRKRYQETKLIKKAEAADRNTSKYKPNRFGEYISKQDAKLEVMKSQDFEWQYTQRRSEYNKENRITTALSTEPQKRNSKPRKSIEGLAVTQSAGTYVDGNQNQFVAGTSNRSSFTTSTDPVTVSNESSIHPTKSSIEDSALFSFIVEAAWTKRNGGHPYRQHSKFGGASNSGFSKVLDMVAWRKYVNYLNQMSSAADVSMNRK